MKILITGCAGFIGYHIAEKILKDLKKCKVRSVKFGEGEETKKIPEQIQKEKTFLEKAKKKLLSVVQHETLN